MDSLGQQVRRVVWFDGSYLYLPMTLAGINIKQFEKIKGAQQQAPAGHSDDEARYEMIGETGPHGGGSFVALTAEGEFVVPPELLIPLVGRPVDGLSDLTVQGIVHSHWLDKESGLICLCHWIWPGGYVMSGEDAFALIADPDSEKGKAKLAEIRKAITAA